MNNLSESEWCVPGLKYRVELDKKVTTCLVHLQNRKQVPDGLRPLGVTQTSGGVAGWFYLATTREAYLGSFFLLTAGFLDNFTSISLVTFVPRYDADSLASLPQWTLVT